MSGSTRWLPRFRRFAIGYWLLVCFSAVYLNHHYLLDLFIGLGIACFVLAAARFLFGPLEAAAQPEPGLSRQPVRT